MVNHPNLCLVPCLFLIVGSSPLQVGSAPLPPRFTNPDPLDRFQRRQHLKEDSPLRCSRAVSRWVRQAWTVVTTDAFNVQNFKASPSDTDALISKYCPFKAPDGDLYRVQEQTKPSQAMDGSHRCGICNKTFKSEYHLDRHLDRRHSFQDLVLLDSYQGGPVTEIFDLKTNQTSPIDPHSARVGPWSVCLEQFCTIFDVCDRPVNRRYPLVHNDLSITDPSHRKNRSRASKKSADGHCDPQLLRVAWGTCQGLVDTCFPVEGTESRVRRANVYLKRNLCGALESCKNYMTRRQYHGTSGEFTEAAFTGTLTRPINSLPAYQITLIILGGVGLILAIMTTICCCLEQHDSREVKRRGAELKPYAYKSATDFATPSAATARRRMPVQTGSDLTATGPTDKQPKYSSQLQQQPSQQMATMNSQQQPLRPSGRSSAAQSPPSAPAWAPMSQQFQGPSQVI